MASNREHQRRFLDRQRAQGLRRLALQVGRICGARLPPEHVDAHRAATWHPPEDPGRWAATGALIAEAEAAGILAERLAPGPAIEDLATPVMPSAAVLRTEKGRAGCPASR